jgi:glutathione peroxidase
MNSTVRRTVFDFDALDIEGAPVPLNRYRSQVLLIVNVASRCGYTPQYGALESLYRRHRLAGFTVLGFPCNQFGGQEPGSHADIRVFCEERYEVSFPLFSKVDVNGPGTHPLFQFLKTSKPGWLGSRSIKWNFTKFLVGRDGRPLKRYGSKTRPEHIEPDVVAALAS